MKDKKKDYCFLAGIGFFLSIFVFYVSSRLLYISYHEETSLSDSVGDYQFIDFTTDVSDPKNKKWTQKRFYGVWVIENPYYFVHNEKGVNELENWHQSKLEVFPDGTFKLTCPPTLLCKLLLLPNYEWNDRKTEALSKGESRIIQQAQLHSITGIWSQQTDHTKQRYFCFQSNEQAIPQRIQYVILNDERIQNRSFDQAPRLHWSTCSSIEYPREGIIWKKQD